MAALSVQRIQLETSLTPSFASADAAGDTFANNGKTFLYIKNEGAGTIVATVNSLVDCDQGHDHDVDISVQAGSEELCGPFSANRFNNSANAVAVSYDDVTDVSVAAISLG